MARSHARCLRIDDQEVIWQRPQLPGYFVTESVNRAYEACSLADILAEPIDSDRANDLMYMLNEKCHTHFHYAIYKRTSEWVLDFGKRSSYMSAIASKYSTRLIGRLLTSCPYYPSEWQSSGPRLRLSLTIDRYTDYGSFVSEAYRTLALDHDLRALGFTCEGDSSESDGVTSRFHVHFEYVLPTGGHLFEIIRKIKSEPELSWLMK